MTTTITDDDRRHLVTIASTELGAYKVSPNDRVRLLRMKLVELCAVRGRATMRLTDLGSEEMTKLVDQELREGVAVSLAGEALTNARRYPHQP